MAIRRNKIHFEFFHLLSLIEYYKPVPRVVPPVIVDVDDGPAMVAEDFPFEEIATLCFRSILENV